MNRSLKHSFSISENDNSGHVGSDNSPAASNTSYMPPGMLAATRTHLASDSRAAANADSFQVFDRPSDPGSFTGQRNTSPWRLTARNRQTG